MTPLLSILTPAVPKRFQQLEALCSELQKQIGDRAVEHLILMDNKRRTVGEKRDALLRAAHGAYVAYVDDDDWISPDYVTELLLAIESKPDVVTFQQEASVNGFRNLIEFKLGNPNEPFKSIDACLDKGQMPVTKRNAWHICAWRRMLAMCSHFPASNYGEDWAYAAPLCAIPNLKEVHIPKVLHFYNHSAETTEAPAPNPT